VVPHWNENKVNLSSKEFPYNLFVLLFSFCEVQRFFLTIALQKRSVSFAFGVKILGSDA
jgi:hypothetical protein